MLRSGDLCKHCVGACDKKLIETRELAIPCYACEQHGVIGDDTCDTCNGFGYIDIDSCPRECIGSAFTEAIKLALMAKHHLPISGGMCDQSFWFIELVHRLEYEQSLIEEAYHKRAMAN